MNAIPIPCNATATVEAAIASLGRTEDIRFSPGNRRLAVAEFSNSRITIFDIEIAQNADSFRFALTGGVRLESSALNEPHGLDFIDEQTVIVTNRSGDAVILALPEGTPDLRLHEARPIQVWPGHGALLDAPGSVVVTDVEHGLREVLICNNDGHTISRHVVDPAAGFVTRRSDVLLRKWLDVPDGICVSRDRRWIAISNHATHDVLLYEYDSALDEHTDPVGMLRGLHYPHGLRFSADGRHLFVADSAAPYVQVFASGDDGWRGVSHPAVSIRVMDDDVFERGAYRHDEGGTKGIDFDRERRVMVTTSMHQPLSVFDARALTACIADAANGRGREQHALNVGYELHYLKEARARNAKAEQADHMLASRSWRLTAPLRRVFDAWQKDRS